VTLGTKVVTVGGCAKGSGMIHPNMATMLAYVTTDAAIDKRELHAMVKRVADRTFNNLTVDGDTSTNDMLLVLANGASGARIGSAQRAAFEQALFEVCNDLCAAIAADGEGATKRVEIHVKGGRTFTDARKAAKGIANSNLVKTALFGNDPNWGRILCAIGYSGASFSEKAIRVAIGPLVVCKALRPVAFDAAKMQKVLRAKVVPIHVDLGEGTQVAIAHTCDLTYDYIKINAEYTT
jgi:glutamate N-acetyltransferase/amino-acid N-acetyltransferase